MNCDCCHETSYESFVKPFNIVGSRYNICELCCSERFDMTPNYNYMKQFVFLKDHSRFYVWRDRKKIYFHTFVSLERYLNEGDNYLYMFGQSTLMYVAHTSKMEMNEDLNQFGKIILKHMWDTIVNKTGQNTVLTPKYNWIKDELQGVNKEIMNLQQKRQRLLNII